MASRNGDLSPHFNGSVSICTRCKEQLFTGAVDSVAQKEKGSTNAEDENSLLNSCPEDKILLQPMRYIIQLPGKHIRIHLAKAFNYWLSIPDDKCNKIASVIQTLHNASLLIDDIEDNSTLRRGIPVAHQIFGTPITINSANYSYFLCMQQLFELGNAAQISAIFVDQMLELHRGQGMELYWREQGICPTLEEYKLMASRKTGGLFVLLLKLMHVFSSVQNNYEELVTLLGLYFQIRDDYSSLMSQEYADNKTFAEDITEGKFNFPIIHAIKSNPEDLQLISIIRQAPKNIEVKKYTVGLLQKLGSIEYTKQVLQELQLRITTIIEEKGGNPLLEEVLKKLRI